MADINVIVLPDGTEYPVSDFYLPVAISNPTDGQVLKYDATNDVWYNGTGGGGGASSIEDLDDVNITTPTDGQVLKYDATNDEWVNANDEGGGTAADISVDDTDLEYEADDVQEALEKIYKRITLAEYEQLSQAEKYNGTIYFITDVKGANQNLTKEITNAPIATFDTDRAERLVNLEVAITATGGGGTPDAPIKIYGNDSCSIFHNSINLWNEKWEVGTIDPSTGENQASTQNIRSIDFIPCQPSTQYFFVTSSGSFVVFFYDQNKQLLQYNSANNSSLTTPNNCYYIRFRTSVSYGTTYNNDLGVNISTDYTTYRPFSGATIPFGQTVYGGRLNVGSGVLTVTHGYKDLGNLGVTDWAYDSGSGRFYYPYAITDSKHYSASELPNAICSCYPMVKRNDLADKTITIVWNGSANYVLAMDSDYTNANDFKTAVTGQKIAYELATPTTIQLDSKQIQAIIGNNNIYADTGDIIDLKFILSVGKAIS